MGGFFSDFEAIQTVILRIIVETIVNLHAIEKTQSRGDVASMEWDDVVSMAWDDVVSMAWDDVVSMAWDA